MGSIPIADFTFSCAGLQCTFDGTPSLPLVDPVDSYSWDFSQGGSSLGVSALPTPSFNFPSSGSFDITLTVTDQGVASAPVTKPVVVSSGSGGTPTAGPYDGRTPGTPYASFTWNCSGATVNFNDTSMPLVAQAGGSITTRSWDFGDGQISTATNPSHAYASTGSWIATLSVFNNTGKTDTMQRIVVVASTGCTGIDDQSLIDDTTVYQAPLTPPSWCNGSVVPPPAPFTRSTGMTVSPVGNPAADHTRLRWFSDFQGGSGSAQDFNLDKQQYIAAGFVANPMFLSVDNPAGGKQWAIVVTHPTFGTTTSIKRASQGNQGLEYLSLSQCPGDFTGQNTQSTPNPACTTPNAMLNPTLGWTLPGVKPGRCELEIGKTYYYNVIYSAPPDFSQRTCNPKQGQNHCSFLYSNKANL